jgi:hypothetical protein
VVLGKAVPAEDDTSSLLVEVQELARRSGIEFESIELNSGGAGAPVDAPAAEQTTADPGSVPATSGDGAAPAAPEPAPATEAAAAVLPLGATVGPAGLPVMPYDLHFTGDFFEVADFISGVDKLVRSAGPGVGVDGRLVTIDGFAFGQDETAGFPHLIADLHVTTYVAPADQGLTAGATPGAPPAAGAASPVPASSEAVPPATATFPSP